MVLPPQSELKFCAADWPARFTPPAGEQLDTAGICRLVKELGISMELPMMTGELDLIEDEGVTIVNHLPQLPSGPAYRCGLANAQDVVERDVLPAYREAILLGKEYGGNVLIFTGVLTQAEKHGSYLRLMSNLRTIVEFAEEHGVVLLLEHLNDKGEGDPDSMKGHDDYMGCDLRQVARWVRRINSANLRLLFDVYHVALMHPQDYLELLDENMNIIGHIHVAGILNGGPSRVELDAPGQQINYREIGAMLRRRKYSGFVGFEWITTAGRGLFESYQAAIRIMSA